MDFFSPYAGVRSIFQKYWNYYGGTHALVRSPYVHASLLMTLLLAPAWVQAGWWKTPLSIMPNVLGFSLGGYAIWLALGDEKFRQLISGGSEEKASPFLELNSAFVHFIILQIITIFVALANDAYFSENRPDASWVLLIWFPSYLVFIYALMSALAATMAIFRAATWYDTYQGRQKENGKDQE